jgi:hypothetical protein
MSKRFTDQQVIRILQEAETNNWGWRTINPNMRVGCCLIQIFSDVQYMQDGVLNHLARHGLYRLIFALFLGLAYACVLAWNLSNAALYPLPAPTSVIATCLAVRWSDRISRIVCSGVHALMARTRAVLT